jgi:hypothetical protein
MSTHYSLSAREKATLEELAKLVQRGHSGSKGTLYRIVAEKLHISPIAIRNRLSRIRRRYDRAEAFTMDYREFRKKINKPGRRIL